MTCVAFYSGSFDPVTNGHMDVIARASRLFEGVVVGVGVHHGKAPMFSGDDRIAMVMEEVMRLGLSASVRAVAFDGLAVDAARKYGAGAIVRGVRDGSDFDYEMQMAGLNGAMAPDIETVFIPAAPSMRHLASSFVRQIVAMGGDVSSFVPPSAAMRLTQKLQS